MKKGDKVILHLFTGLATAVREVKKVTKDTVIIIDNSGNELTFDKKTLKQIDPVPKKPRFANYITEDDGSFAPKKRGRKPKKKEPENLDEDDFDEDEFVEV